MIIELCKIMIIESSLNYALWSWGVPWPRRPRGGSCYPPAGPAAPAYQAFEVSFRLSGFAFVCQGWVGVVSSECKNNFFEAM